MLRASSLPFASSLAPGLWLAIVEGCFAMAPQTFMAGVFLTGFALLLGADSWALGLLAAIPALGQSAQLLTPVLLARGADRKRLTVWLSSAARYLWAPMVLVPFLPIDSSAQLGLFLALLGVSTVLAQMGGVAWTDWMADLVPDAQRGRYFGLRNALCAIVGMGLVALGSRFLDAFPEGQRRWGFVGLVAAGLLGAVASQLALSRQPEAERAPRRPNRAPFRSALGNRPFRRLTRVMVVWTFMTALTGPFCYAYALQELRLGYGLVGTHALVVAALSIGSQPLWGRLIDQRGAQFALLLAMGPVCLHPVYWATVSPDFLLPFWLDALSSGLFWPGVTLATTALLMEAAPSGERAGYMGVYNAAMGLATCVAAVAAGALLARLAHQPIGWGDWTVSAWQALMLVGVTARLACLAAFWRLPRLRAPLLMIETWPGGLPDPVVTASVPVRAESGHSTDAAPRGA
ncbi:MAG: MFS transporter [Candidatus Sericytochromatia bacterium]